MTNNAQHNDVFTEAHRFLKESKFSHVRKLLLDKKTNAINKKYADDVNHAWYVIGDSYYREGKLELALYAFRRSFLAWKEDYQAAWAISDCYINLEDPIKSEKYLRKALRIKPGDQELLYNLANTFFDQKDFFIAKVLYESIVSKDKELARKVKKNLSLTEKNLVENK